MRNCTKLLLGIIISLLTIIYMICDKYELIRYLFLKIFSPNGYIKKYKNLPKKSDKIIISFQLDNYENIDNLKPMISSLLDQTIKVDEIILNIPNTFDKTKLPDFIHKVAIILTYERNYGQGAKLLPILLREKEDNTIICALDTNKIYGNDFIETMIHELKKEKDTVLTNKNKELFILTGNCVNSNIIDRSKENYTNEWICQNSKKLKYIDYSLNYNI